MLDSSELTEVADDNFKFDENGRKLSRWVQNTGKREIAHYVILRLVLQTCNKSGKLSQNTPVLPQVITIQEIS